MARLRPSHPWNPGYSIPKNVLDEPYGQGVIVTKQAKRGTISALQPEWLVDGAGAPPPAAPLGSLGCAHGNGSLGGATIKGNSLRSGSLGSLSGTSLGAKGANGVEVGGMSDPIANFGRQGAALIMSEVKYLKESDRVAAMRHILDSIDPQLFDMVAKRAEALGKSGVVPRVAMERALAASLAGRYLEQLVKMGKTGAPPTFGVLGLGLGTVDPEGLGGFFADVWGGIKKGAGAVGSAAKTVGKGIGKLACKAAGNPGTSIAAGAAGGPAGATGAQLASELCGGGTQSGGGYVPPPAAPFPIMPVLLIGGGLLAVLALRK